MKLKYAIEIKAAPEVVFSWLGAPEKAMEWQTNVVTTTMVNQTPDMVGSTFVETIEESGGSTEMHGVVTDYRQDRGLAMHLDGKYNTVDVRYDLAGTDGHTRVTVTADVRFKAFLKVLSIVFRRRFTRELLAQLRAEHARLRDLCERPAGTR